MENIRLYLDCTEQYSNNVRIIIPHSFDISWHMEKAYLHSSAKLTNFLKIGKRKPTIVS